MFFPFTFAVSVPGIINPFSKPPYPSSGTTMTSSLQEKRWVPGGRPHPSSLPPPVPLARKRGWQPSSPEPSPAVAVTTSTSGYLNVHPRYSDFTVTQETREENEGTDMPAGGYFCIAGCAYILSCPCMGVILADNAIRMHVPLRTMLFAHGGHGHAVFALHFYK